MLTYHCCSLCLQGGQCGGTGKLLQPVCEQSRGDHLVQILEQLRLGLMVQCVGMRHIVQRLLGLQRWEHNLVLALHSKPD